MTFRRIGILGHPHRPETGEVCHSVGEALRERGIASWERAHWDPGDVNKLVEESDLVIAIGGDGSMLRAARLCATFHVPVFGINAGHLGFLTEARPDSWPSSL